MRRRLPPLNALLAFEAAARHKNFTRAAQELSVAQPAITRHVSNIEAWLGTRLFTRNGNVVDLSEDGRALAEVSTSLFDRLELSVRALRRPRNNELVAGASFGVAHLWIMPRISRMRTASGMNINLVTADDYRFFDEPTVDFSIRFGNGDFEQNWADLLFAERCQIIASPGFLMKHPEFDAENPVETIDPGLMLDHGDPNAIGWMDWRRWCEMTGTDFPGFDHLTRVQSYPTMLDMVCAGDGISIGTIGIEDDLIASGKLTCVGPALGREGFGYYLVYREDMLENGAFAALRDFLIRDSRS
ncbi:MAG: LysR family transcriptional regulator [Pseudomonadota bacterium]